MRIGERSHHTHGRNSVSGRLRAERGAIFPRMQPGNKLNPARALQ
jgi:hypothetical protein